MTSHPIMLPLFISAVFHAAIVSIALLPLSGRPFPDEEAGVFFVNLETRVPPGDTGPSPAAVAPGRAQAAPKTMTGRLDKDMSRFNDPAQQRRIEPAHEASRPPEGPGTPDSEGVAPGTGPGEAGMGGEDPWSSSAGSSDAGKDPGGSGGLSPAVIAKLSKPAYPRYSRIRGEEGTVVLEVNITADGRPESVTVLCSSGHERLDYAARKAFEKALFLPARRHGEAVASTRRIACRFTLDDE